MRHLDKRSTKKQNPSVLETHPLQRIALLNGLVVSSANGSACGWLGFSIFGLWRISNRSTSPIFISFLCWFLDEGKRFVQVKGKRFHHPGMYTWGTTRTALTPGGDGGCFPEAAGHASLLVRGRRRLRGRHSNSTPQICDESYESMVAFESF